MQALRDALRDIAGPELTALLGPYGADLARTVPDLVASAGPFPDPPALPPEEQQQRLFDGFAELINNVSRRAPLVLLLDDLQWAPSLGLLLHISRRLGDSRALILRTYRNRSSRNTLRSGASGPSSTAPGWPPRLPSIY